MDVFPLKTDTYIIANRCYRRNPYRPQTAKQLDSTDFGDTPDLYGDEPDVSCKSYHPDERQPKINSGGNADKWDKKEKTKTVKKQENEKTAYKTEDERIVVHENKWTSEMYVPQAFLGKLIGIKGRTRNDIEKSTNCRLKIPRGPGENLIITSFSGLEAVQICLDRIDDMLLHLRQTTKFSHFVSYPLQDSSELQTSFKKFQEGVLASPNIPDATKNPNLFIKSNKLHCTISMLRLLDDRDLEMVKKVLEEAVNDFQLHESIDVEVKGLSIFNDDPSEVMVVYANVKNPLFQDFADHINRKLIEATLSFPGFNDNLATSVALHMTLMNSKYAAQSSGSQNRKAFDATKLLDEFGNYDFGRVSVDRVVINVFGNTCGEGYSVSHKIPFTKS